MSPAATPRPVAPTPSRLTSRHATAIAVLLSAAVALRPAVDSDLWWHLRIGQWMVRTHRLYGADVLSSTTLGKTRVAFDWLAQLALYGTYRVGGLLGVAVLTAALAALGMWLVTTACRPMTGPKVGLVVLGAAASAIFWSPRPQMATFVGVAGVVAALAAERRGQRRLWWLVPGFALWSNLHLGWFYGLALLWGTALGWTIDRRLGRDDAPAALVRRVVAVAAACTAAVFVHPEALGLPRVVLTDGSIGPKYIQEYQPPNWHHAEAVPFFVLLVLAAALLVAGRRRVTLTEAVLVVGSGVAAANVVRLVPLFATVSVPVACRLLDGWLADRRAASGRRALRRRPDLGFNRVAVGACAAALVLLGAVRLSSANVQAKLDAEAPRGATRWLDAHHPPGTLFNDYDWGGWLIWKAPRYPVWIDGRTDLHQDQLTDYSRVAGGHGWQQVFARDHVGVALIRTDGPLAHALSTSPDWRVAYRDPQATVFVRR